jgi:hypothetical protein
MNDIEDLVRATFAERQHDVGAAAPSLAAARERARHARRQRVAVGLGAVAAVAVLAGSTLAVRGGPAAGPAPRVSAATRPPAPAPTPLRFVAAPIVSAGGRTSATLTWAPAWLPAGMRETRREVAAGEQTRDYRAGSDRTGVRVTVARAGCASGGTAVEVGSRPGRLRTVHSYLDGHEVCVPLAGGGSLVAAVGGTSDTARDAIRVAGSVRPGSRDPVVLPVSGPGPVTTVGIGADTFGPGQWIGEIDTADVYTSVSAPDPGGLDPNFTVGGRPAHISTSAAKGTFLTVVLTPRLWASLSGDRDRTIAVATGLRVGPAPDYGWLGR